MKDTPGSITEKYRKMLLSLGPAERLAMACRMLRTAKAFAKAGISRRLISIEDPKVMRQELFLHFYRNDFSQYETKRILDSINGGRSEDSIRSDSNPHDRPPGLSQ